MFSLKSDKRGVKKLPKDCKKHQNNDAYPDIVRYFTDFEQVFTGWGRTVCNS